MLTKSFLDNPKHWHDRAEETRAVAEGMFNEDSKCRLLKIAMEYERLAHFAERRLAQVQNTLPHPSLRPEGRRETTEPHRRHWNEYQKYGFPTH